MLVGDVSSEADCAALVAEAAAGGLDGLVCNVGTGRGGGLAGTSAEDWDFTFSVNLRSHFLLARSGSAHGRRRVHRVHRLGRRAAAGEPAAPCTTRRKQVCSGSPVTSRSKGRAGACGQTWSRPASSTPRSGGGRRRTTVPRAHARTPRAPGHRVGGRGGRRLPALGRRELHHGTGARGRRRPHAHLTRSHSRPLRCRDGIGSRSRRRRGSSSRSMAVPTRRYCYSSRHHGEPRGVGSVVPGSWNGGV